MLLHARRLLDGQPLYAPPSLDFIPYLYTPLYPALLALLSKLLPFGYLLGRGVSIAAFAGALALLVVVAARQGGPAFATGGWSPGRDRWLGLPHRRRGGRRRPGGRQLRLHRQLLRSGARRLAAAAAGGRGADRGAAGRGPAAAPPPPAC